MNIENKELSPLSFPHVYALKSTSKGSVEARLGSPWQALIHLKEKCILDNDLKINKAITDRLPGFKANLRDYPQIIDRLNQLINRTRTTSVVISEYDIDKPINYTLTYSISGLCKAIYSKFKDAQIKIVFDGSSAHDILSPLYCHNTNRFLSHFGIPYSILPVEKSHSSDIDFKFYISNAHPDDLDKFDQCVLEFILKSIFPNGLPDKDKQLVQGALRLNFYRYNKIFWNQNDWIGSFKFHDLDISVSKPRNNQAFLIEKDRLCISILPCTLNTKSEQYQMYFSLDNQGTEEESWQSTLDQSFRLLHTNVENVNSKCFPRIKNLESQGFFQPSQAIEEQLVRKQLLAHETFAKLMIDEFHHHGKNSLELLAMLMINTLYTLSTYGQLTDLDFVSLSNYLKKVDRIQLPIFKELVAHFVKLSDKQKVNSEIIQKHFALFYLVSCSGGFQSLKLEIDEAFNYLKINDFYFFHHLTVKNSLELIDDNEGSDDLVEFTDILFQIILNQEPFTVNIDKINEIISLLTTVNSKVEQKLYFNFLTLIYRSYPKKIDIYSYGKSLYHAIIFFREDQQDWFGSIHQIFHTKGLKFDMNKIITTSIEQRKLYLSIAYLKTKDSTLKEFVLSEWAKNDYSIDDFLFYLKEIPAEAITWLNRISKNHPKKVKDFFISILKENLASRSIFDSFLSWCENYVFANEVDEKVTELKDLELFFSQILATTSEEKFNSTLNRLHLDLQQKVWQHLSEKFQVLNYSQKLILLKKGLYFYRKLPNDNLIGKGIVELVIALDRKNQLEVLHQFEISFLKILSLLGLDDQVTRNYQEWLSLAIKGLFLAKESFEHKKNGRYGKTHHQNKADSAKEFEEMFQNLLKQIISPLTTPALINKEDFAALKQLFPKTFIPCVNSKIIVLGWCYDAFNLSHFSADFYAMMTKSPNWDIQTIQSDMVNSLPYLKDLTWLIDLCDRFSWLENMNLTTEQKKHLILNFLRSPLINGHPDFLMKIFKHFNDLASLDKNFVTKEIAHFAFSLLKQNVEKASEAFKLNESITFLKVFQNIENFLEKEVLEDIKKLFIEILPVSISKANVITIDYLVHRSVKYQLPGNQQILDQLVNECLDKNIPLNLIEPYLSLFKEKQLKKAFNEILLNLKADKWSLWSCKLQEFTKSCKEKIFIICAQFFLQNNNAIKKIARLRKNLTIIFNHYLSHNSLECLRFIRASSLFNNIFNCEPVLKSLVQHCRNNILNQTEQILIQDLFQKILKKIENEGISEDIHDALNHENIAKNLPTLLVEQLKFLSCNSFQRLSFLLDHGEFKNLLENEIENLSPYMHHALGLVIEEFSRDNNGLKEILINKLLNILYFFVFSHPLCRDIESIKKVNEYRKYLHSLMDIYHSNSTVEEKLKQEQNFDQSIFELDQKAFARYIPAYEIFLEKLQELIVTHSSLIENPQIRVILRSFVLRNYKNLFNCYKGLSGDQIKKVCGLLLQCDYVQLEETSQIISNFLLPLCQTVEEKISDQNENFQLLLNIKAFLLFFYKLEHNISLSEEQFFQVYKFYLTSNQLSLKEYSYAMDLLLRLEKLDQFKETEILYQLHELFLTSFHPSFHIYVYADKKKIPFLTQKLKILLEKPFSPYYIKIQSLHFENYLKIWNFPSDEKMFREVVNIYEQLLTGNVVVSLKESELGLGLDFIIRTVQLFCKSYSYQNGYYPYFISYLKAFLGKLKPVLAQSKIIRENFRHKILKLINPNKLSKEEKKLYASDRKELDAFFHIN